MNIYASTGVLLLVVVVVVVTQGVSGVNKTDEVQDPPGECVTKVSLTAEPAIACMRWNITLRDTPSCQEKETWPALLVPCNADENQTNMRELKMVKAFDDGRVKHSGEYRLMILNGENVSSNCERLFGYMMSAEELENILYMEFNVNQVILTMGSDPRIRRVHYTIREGTTNECGKYSRIIKKDASEKFDTQLKIFGPYNPSLQHCFSFSLDSHNGTKLLYPTVINYPDKKPQAFTSIPHPYQWWRVGVVVGVVMAVVMMVVNSVVVLSKKIWLPSTKDQTMRTISGPKTVEVLLIYLPDLQHQTHLRYLKKTLATFWTVLDLNERFPKDHISERLGDEIGWLSRVLKQEEGVKVVVVESPSLQDMINSIIKGVTNPNTRPREKRLRFALKEILVTRAMDYDKIFVVRFNDEIPYGTETKEKMGNSLMVNTTTNNTPGSSPSQGNCKAEETSRDVEKRLEVLVQNCRYVLPSHSDILINNLKGEQV